MKNKENKIDYVEITVNDLAATKSFFRAAFGWHFKDYGEHYATFSHAGLTGGFIEEKITTPSSPVLLVIYRHDLEKTMSEITQAGGTITKYPFSFPGGRRFHFTDTNGIEFAVWSELTL